MTPKKPDDKVDAWMPLWIGAYLADTSHLSRDEHGGYLLMLMAYWRNKGPLIDDGNRLANIVRASPADWKRLRPVLAEFFLIEEGFWSHERANKELIKAGDLKRAKADRSNAGNAVRWAPPDGDAAERGRHLRSGRLAAARDKGTHSQMEWECMKTFHSMRCVRCRADAELVKDHITPIYQGGSDAIDNIQPLCRKCNASKGPEATDHRKQGWRSAMEGGIKRLLKASPTPSPLPTVEDPSGSSPSVGDDEPLPSPTSAGLLCRRLKQLGFLTVSSGHPTLLALLAAGATEGEFTAFTTQALTKRDPFAYLLTVVQSQREKAARLQIHRGPLPNAQEVIEQRNRAVAERWAAQQEETYEPD